MSMTTAFTFRSSMMHTELYYIPAELLAEVAAAHLSPFLRRAMAEALCKEAMAKFRYRVLHTRVLIGHMVQSNAPLFGTTVLAALRLQVGWLKYVLDEMKNLPLEVSAGWASSR